MSRSPGFFGPDFHNRMVEEASEKIKQTEAFRRNAGTRGLTVQQNPEPHQDGFDNGWRSL